jgi:5-methylcytosine-specific restriction enzyme subunit McrC
VTTRTLREWDYLPVADIGDDVAIGRAAAAELVGLARASKVGGAEGEAVLAQGHNRLRAQQVVGVLVGKRDCLEILPKIDTLDAAGCRQQLVHMLARVLDLEISQGAMAQLGWQRHDLLEILIRLFTEQLFAAVHRGLPRRYIDEEDDLPALRGRLNVERQYRVLAATPHRLACRFQDLSSDIPLNQIMKAAVTLLAHLARSSINQRKLNELSLAFADVRAVPINQLPWDKVVLDRTNASWAGLLQLAKLLLGQRFQTTTVGGGSGYSLLFEMNTLFEEFIGRSLKRALKPLGLDVLLQRPQDHVLETEEGVRRFATKPDIMIMRAGVPVMIVDTKWKRLKGGLDDPKHGVAQGDVYQMMAYLQVYQCEDALLLYPHHHGIGAPEGVLSRHRVRGAEGRRLLVGTIDVTSLTNIEARLRQLVQYARFGATGSAEHAQPQSA